MRKKKYGLYETLLAWLPGGFAILAATLALAGWLMFMFGDSGLVYGLRTGVRYRNPVITQRMTWPLAVPTTIAANDDGVYLLFAEDRTLMAFSHEGAFLYEVHFPYVSNSQHRLYTEGEDLYYRNAVRDVYHLRAGQLAASYLDEAGKAKAEELETRYPSYGTARECRYGEYRYRIQGLDVMRQGADGTETVFLDVPGYLWFFQPTVSWACSLLSLLAAFLSYSAALHIDKTLSRKRKA